jgi:hypothetical protein
MRRIMIRWPVLWLAEPSASFVHHAGVAAKSDINPGFS